MEPILFSACVFIFLTTLCLIVWSIVAQKKLPQLKPSHSFDESLPLLTVVIPARNEEEDIEKSLVTILKQKHIALEVIVVNDHSSDTTQEIIEAVALEDTRVTVINNPELRDGWLGKANAMQTGAAIANGDYIVFTDADIIHSQTCFASALEIFLSHEYDFFSFSPLWINKTLAENINFPMYFMGFLKLMSIPKIDDPTSKNALASGAFMLVKRSVFKNERGFECVKGNMFDDVGLAEHLKSKRYRVSYWLGPECSRVRLFKNSKDAFWGTTKNILSAVNGNVSLALPLIFVGVFQYWTPILCVLYGSANESIYLILVGLSTYLIQYLSFYSIRKTFTFHPIKLFAFPLVVIVSACCITRAAWNMKKGIISWRGRKIKVN